MNKLYIIAEAAQGYEGSKEVSKLLVRSAAKAGADAIKFQVVYADDLAEKGYEYYELFKSLEMPSGEWQEIRDYAREQKIDFVIDIFGPQSVELAKTLKADGVKIHSTCFFDDSFIDQVMELNSTIYLSTGGIHPEEVEEHIQKFSLRERGNVVLMYGFQAEPTPIESNHLARIPSIIERYGLPAVGFMDHSDGDGPYAQTLSAVAMGMGVRVLEKHITLDRKLEMEDYISALGVQDFAAYVENMNGLLNAIGQGDLALTEAETAYRHRAVKRVVATSDLKPGTVLDANTIKLSRASNAAGAFKLDEILGKTLQSPANKGEGIDVEMVA